MQPLAKVCLETYKKHIEYECMKEREREREREGERERERGRERERERVCEIKKCYSV